MEKVTTKPYRPEGFKELASKASSGDASSMSPDFWAGVDYGADALLEGLRKEALLFRQGDQGSGTVNFDEGDRGHLCFIPLEGK